MMKIFLEKRKNWNEKFLEFSEKNYKPGCFPIGSFDFVAGCGTRTDRLDFFNWSNYAPHIGNNLLNSEYIMLPAKELYRQKYMLLAMFGADCKMFVRPNAGTKLFTGQLLDIEQFAQFSQDFGNELVIISRPQKILGEWRFMVTKDGEILGKSLYKYQDNFVEISSCPPIMEFYVKQVVAHIKNSPPLIVVDVAQLHDTSFRIIELNSAHHSGLYAMQPEPIVEYIAAL